MQSGEDGGWLVDYASALDRMFLLPICDVLHIINRYIDECAGPDVDYPPMFWEDDFIAPPYGEPVGVE